MQPDGRPVTAPPGIELIGIPAIPLVRRGDDLPRLIFQGLCEAGLELRDNDVVVVAQKVVSKAEGRMVDLAQVEPSTRAQELAALTCKDPRVVEVVLRESKEVLRTAPQVMIVEHRLGLVMANAGVDQSNVAPTDDGEQVLLLPENPDASAERLREGLTRLCSRRVAVVINDSFGRAWRIGTVGVAIGAAGLPSLIDKRGDLDMFGRVLRVTVIGFADEIAAAASLLMGQADEARPVIIVRGLRWNAPFLPAASVIRPLAEDVFR